MVYPEEFYLNSGLKLKSILASLMRTMPELLSCLGTSIHAKFPKHACLQDHKSNNTLICTTDCVELTLLKTEFLSDLILKDF